jgi:hypothetical protein
MATTKTAAPTTVVPSAQTVRRFLKELLGKEVSVSTTRAMRIRAHLPLSIAIYTQADHSVAAVCAFDLALSNAAGAALASVAPNVAEEQLQSGKLGDSILENFKEVLNISAKWFQLEGAPKVGFRSLHLAPPDKVPASALPVMTRPAGRVDLKVEIAGYRGGRLTIVAR